MADFDDPKVSTTYTQFPTKVREAVAAVATMKFTGDSNIPDDSVRYNRSTKQLEEYDSGSSTWAGLEITNLADSSVTLAKLAAAVQALLVPTGAILGTFQTSAPSGWLFLQGGTIGSATSGASVRANADTEALYTYLWNYLSNTEAPVSTGRGASAAADFAANKTITLPDYRGYSLIGKTGAGTASTMGAKFGALDHTHTTPNHTHTIATHTHTMAHDHTVVDHTHGAGTLRASVGYKLDAAADGIQFDLDGANTFDADYRWAASGVSVASGYTGVPSTLVVGSTAAGGAQTTSGSSAANTGGSGTLTSNSGEGGGTSGTANAPGFAANWMIKM